jgi:hypothetical protein
MSAQVSILQLPAAGAITGSESVPIVQNGVTVQTTTGAIASAPSQVYTYLTVAQTPQLPNSRYVGATNGLVTTDGGAQGLFNISTTGALLSLVNSGTGFQVKSDATTLVNRSIAVSGAGLGITNGSGISGDPTIALAGQVLNLANLSANGLMTISSGGAISAVTLLGTANQVTVANGNGVSGVPTIALADNPILGGTASLTLPIGTSGNRPVAPVNGMIRYNTTTSRFEGYQGGAWVTAGTGDGTVTTVTGTADQITVVNGTTTPVISLASNPIVPGTASMTLPIGSTAARPVGSNGMIRYNTDIGLFEGYVNGSWQTIAAGSGVTSVATGTGLTGGPITSTGTISIADTAVTAGTYGTDARSVTYTVNAQGQITNTFDQPISIPASAINTTIPNSGLTNSSVTFNGVTVALGASGTITATATNALTIGTGLTGTSYNGSSAVTIAIDSTVATLTGTQTLTNKSMSGSSNTFTNIPNSALTNSSVTIGSTAISLGATSLTLAGLTSVTLTQDPSADLQAATKQYVDAKASTGLSYHAPVQCATTQSLAAQTGGTVTYNAPGPEGVGATITLSVALTVLDGYTLLNTNRILVKNEVNQAYNGVYTWATGGTVLTRATDANTYGGGVNQLSQNDYFFVQNGTVNIGSSYVVTTVGVINFTTTAITFSEFSNSQVYSAGTGLTLTGTTFSITNTGVANGSYGLAASVPTIAINAQGQITSASNTAIAINGNQITSGTVGSAYITGSYTGITGVGTLTAGTWTATTIGVAYGGTGLTSYTAGDLLYASGSATLSKLTLGTSGYVLTAGASAPAYVAQSTLSVGTATNATNTGTTADSTNATNYLVFKSATSGNLPELVNSSITCNPSTGKLTGGISGGTF